MLSKYSLRLGARAKRRRSRSQRLAQRPPPGRPPRSVQLRRPAASARTEGAGSVRLVDHQPQRTRGRARQALPAELCRRPLRRRRRFTISEALLRACAQPPGEVLDVAMAIDEGLGARQPQPSTMLAWLSSRRRRRLRAGASAEMVAEVRQVTEPNSQTPLVALEGDKRSSQQAVRRQLPGSNARRVAGSPNQRCLGGRLTHARMIGSPGSCSSRAAAPRAHPARRSALCSFDQPHPPWRPALA